MVNIIILFGSSRLVLFNGERILPSEAVVMLSDHIVLADGVAPVSRRKRNSEILKVFQLLTVLDLAAVQQDRQDGLGGTGIVYRLLREEQRWIWMLNRFSFLWVLLPLEQEDQSVDWPNMKIFG